MENLDDYLLPEQYKQIRRFLEFIRENGGYGVIKLEVKKGEVKFINLGEVSMKMDSSSKQKV